MKFTLEKSIPILERTPKVVRHLLEGLDESWTHQNEGGETWSPYDVIGHLLHGEHTDWMPRLEILLRPTGNKTFVPFDRFAQFTESKGKTLAQLLDEFEAARQKNLQLLHQKNIVPAQLSLTATHPALGTVTLGQLLSTWVVHDLNHIHQITRTMASQYSDETGPWIQYLGILKAKG